MCECGAGNYPHPYPIKFTGNYPSPDHT